MSKATRNIIFLIETLVFSIIGSYLMLYKLALPTLYVHHRLAEIMGRFSGTEGLMWFGLTTVIWLFILQMKARRFSILYIYFCYTIYLILLFVTLFTKVTDDRAMNLYLFDLRQGVSNGYKDALFNLVYFIPLGILYGFNVNRKQLFILAFVTILAVETSQYLFYLGTFSTNDILLNVTGCWIGFEILQRIKKYIGEKNQTQSAADVISGEK